MKKRRDLNSLLSSIEELNFIEKAALVERIMSMMSAPLAQNGEKDNCSVLVAESNPERPDCPHCAAKAAVGHVIKRGMKRGAQRYQCKACGKLFVSTTKTVFAHTRKSADTWRKFIELTISGASLNTCKEECGIAYQTAFNWRHKVLNAFAVNQESTLMSGTVEVDETFIPISYKGNHVQGKFGIRRMQDGAENNMPRKAFQRGTDNKSKHPADKACVFCMVEDGNKGFYAAVPGTGFVSDDMLRYTVGKHIKKESALMLSDNNHTTRRFFEVNGYAHRILSSNVSGNPHGHKPEIVDGLHMQHVNNMHHHLRQFLRPYCGVSSKYLGNYISLFVWLKYVDGRKQKKRVNAVSLARTSAPDCYITGKQIYSRPAVPCCA